MIDYIKKPDNIFGEASIAFVKPIGFNYGIVRESDNVILAIGREFKKYMGDIIRTMYTGSTYGTGDIVLTSDRHGVIHKF